MHKSIPQTNHKSSNDITNVPQSYHDSGNVHSLSIPEELKQHNHFVCWKYQHAPGRSKPAKPIVCARYRYQEGYLMASVIDPSTWTDFSQALAFCEHFADLSGIGFVLTPDLGLTCIDLDHCVEDGTVAPWAQEIVQHFDSYTETSPSGEGLHIWIEGSLPSGDGRKAGNVEAYSSGRYMTVTGDHVPGTPTTIEDRQFELWEFCEQVFPNRQRQQQQPQNSNLLIDDETLLGKMFGGKGGDRLHRIWHNQDQGDLSTGDMILCGALAFWTAKDAARMERLFRQSHRLRDKLDRAARSADKDYLEGTIKIAIQNCTKVYGGVTHA